MIEIECFLCRPDNYAVLIRDGTSGKVAAIDAPDAPAIEAALQRRGWNLDMILITHRHFDHIEGVVPLKAKHGCTLVAPRKAASALPEADLYVQEDTRLMLGETPILVWEIPGHSEDHVGYYLAQDHVIFVGDTLFTMGCGRILGSTPQALFSSIQRIARLPDDTMIYSGHEYTLANARFCAMIEPENAAIAQRMRSIEKMRAAGLPTVPTPLSAERETNVFLRAKNVEEFSARREAKNRA
jgi:hydroxyacylglutathione hydrolase